MADQSVSRICSSCSTPYSPAMFLGGRSNKRMCATCRNCRGLPPLADAQHQEALDALSLTDAEHQEAVRAATRQRVRAHRQRQQESLADAQHQETLRAVTRQRVRAHRQRQRERQSEVQPEESIYAVDHQSNLAHQQHEDTVDFSNDFWTNSLMLQDLQANFRFEWSVCSHCLSPCLPPEHKKSLCCDKGKWIIGETWPRLNDEFKDLLQQHIGVLAGRSQQAGFINDALAFGKLCIDGDGWRFPYRTPSAGALHLHGRTYGQITNNFGTYLTVVPQIHSEINQRTPAFINAVNTLKQYILSHHALANKMRMNNINTSEQYEVIYKRGDAPAGMEQSALGNSSAAWYRIPCITVQVNRRHCDTPQQPNYDMAYEPILFPLLLPNGLGGFSRRQYGDTTSTQGNVFRTVHSYTKRVIYQRMEDLAIMPRLQEQWMLDSFSRAEGLRMAQISQNDNVIANRTKRMAMFAELSNLGSYSNAHSVGRRWNIPLSIPQSPGYLRKKIQDGMAIISSMGNPTLFITITMNPKCHEVEEAIRNYVPQTDTTTSIQALLYSSILVRVFRAKLHRFEQLLRDGVFLGRKAQWLQRCCEFQKRGLIHAHIMLRLDGDQPITPQDVDKLVCARQWIQEMCPERNNGGCDNETTICQACKLRKLVSSLMTHSCRSTQGGCRDRNPTRRPTPAQIADANVCAKGFPKPSASSTYYSSDGRWCYQRNPEDAYVVPYNPAILLALECHVNVEVVTGPGCAAYIRKYQSKLPPSVYAKVQQAGSVTLQEELIEWQKCRVISSAEAACRFISFDLHLIEPACIVLAVHTKDEDVHLVDPNDSEGIEAIVATGSSSTLMSWFARPQPYHQHSYINYFKDYTVTKKEPKKKQFLQDAQGNYVYKRRTTVVPRIARVPFSQNTVEAFCLRLLLLNPVKATAKSFEDICSPSSTFKDEATRLGIFDPDQEMLHALQYLINPDKGHHDWAQSRAAQQLLTRQCSAEELQLLFVTFMLTYPSNIVVCFDIFWPYLLRNPPDNAFQRIDVETLRSSVSALLAKWLQPHRLIPEEFGLPACGADEVDFAEIERHRYDNAHLSTIHESIVNLSNEQQNFIRTATSNIESGSACLYYLRGPAGCGKTATITALIATLRLKGLIVIPTAFMATNAGMFEGGDTCHRIFGLPLLQDYSLQDPTPESRITETMKIAKLLIAASLIVIDEISMLQGCFLECINELLQKLTKTSLPFGGKSIVVTGDFKQVCPVQPGANKQQLIAMSCCSTILWESFTPISLTRQFRTVHNEFVEWASKVGYGIDSNGIVHDGPWRVTFPSFFKCYEGTHEDILNVLNSTFGNTYSDPMAMADNQIICFTHETATQHNDYLASCAATALHSPRILLRAINTAVKVTSDIASAMATPEFIDAVELHSLPPTNLQLFKGCIVALHRNIDVTRGLTNGAKLIVLEISIYILRVKVVSTGLVADLPRMKLSAKASNGIEFERLQFPVKLAYAITSNRSQGQTFPNKVIIDCRSPSFAHGQLYVACTRATNPSNIIILGAPTWHAIAVTYQDLILRSHDSYQTAVQSTIVRAESPTFSVAPEHSQQPPHPPDMDDFPDDGSIASMDSF